MERSLQPNETTRDDWSKRFKYLTAWSIRQTGAAVKHTNLIIAKSPIVRVLNVATVGRSTAVLSQRTINNDSEQKPGPRAETTAYFEPDGPTLSRKRSTTNRTVTEDMFP